jgi:hypothetical protein
VVVPLAEDDAYTYSYINSIYNASVEERQSYRRGRLHIDGVASPDIRAVEYFRWDGEPRQASDRYEQAAPPNDQSQLLIRVTPQYRQRLSGSRWAVDLGDRFGDALVRVVPERLPLAVAVLRGWRP